MVRGSASGRQETAEEDHVEPMFLPDALPAHTIRELDRYWPLLSLGLGNWSEQPNTQGDSGRCLHLNAFVRALSPYPRESNIH